MADDEYNNLINNLTDKLTNKLKIKPINKNIKNSKITYNKLINIFSKELELTEFIKIKNNTPFKRRGLDLLLTKTISLKEALCGFEFSIQYFNNRQFKITNYDTIIKPQFVKVIPGLGMIRENHKGQLHIIFNIEFPDKLDKDTKDKIETLL